MLVINVTLLRLVQFDSCTSCCIAESWIVLIVDLFVAVSIPSVAVADIVIPCISGFHRSILMTSTIRVRSNWAVSDMQLETLTCLVQKSHARSSCRLQPYAVSRYHN